MRTFIAVLGLVALLAGGCGGGGGDDETITPPSSSLIGFYELAIDNKCYFIMPWCSSTDRVGTWSIGPTHTTRIIDEDIMSGMWHMESEDMYVDTDEGTSTWIINFEIDGNYLKTVSGGFDYTIYSSWLKISDIPDDE